MMAKMEFNLWHGMAWPPYYISLYIIAREREKEETWEKQSFAQLDLQIFTFFRCDQHTVHAFGHVEPLHCFFQFVLAVNPYFRTVH